MLRLIAVIICSVATAAIASEPEGQTGSDAVVRALQDRRYQEAIRLLKPLLERSPGDARLWTLHGMALAGAGRYGESLKSYRKALGLKPDFLPALKGAAEIEYRTKDPSAKNTLERIVSLDPDNRTAHAMLGVIAFERRDCKSAVEHFEKSKEQAINNPLALWQFGQCLFLGGRPADAANVFKRLLDARPQDDGVRFNLGLSLYEARRYGEAIDVLGELAERPVPDSAALSLLADAYEANRETPSALSILQKAVKLYPKEERHYVQLAELCMKHGAYELGLEILAVGLKNIPGSPRLHTMRGVLYAQLGRYDDARAEFEQADRLSPEQGLGAIGLSLAMQETRRMPEAIQLLREHLRRNPQDPAANYALAQALMRKGIEPGEDEFEEARKALLKAIELKPDRAQPRVELGKLCLKSGELEKAIREFERALELDPDDLTAKYQLMLALRKAGRNQEAAALSEKIRAMLEKERQDEAQRNRYLLIRAAPERPKEN